MNDALPGLVLGIVIYGIVIELVGVWFVEDKLRYSTGLLIGIAVAVGFVRFEEVGIADKFPHTAVYKADAALVQRNRVVPGDGAYDRCALRTAPQFHAGTYAVERNRIKDRCGHAVSDRFHTHRRIGRGEAEIRFEREPCFPAVMGKSIVLVAETGTHPHPDGSVFLFVDAGFREVP